MNLTDYSSGSIWQSYTTTGTSAVPPVYVPNNTDLDFYKKQWDMAANKANQALFPVVNPEDTIPVKKKPPIETDILDF